MEVLLAKRVMPGILTIVLARLLYAAFAQGPTSVLIVFGLAIGLLPTLYFSAVNAIGFVYGLLGREPLAMTKWFEAGWTKGTLRPRRASG